MMDKAHICKNQSDLMSYGVDNLKPVAVEHVHSYDHGSVSQTTSASYAGLITGDLNADITYNSMLALPDHERRLLEDIITYTDLPEFENASINQREYHYHSGTTSRHHQDNLLQHQHSHLPRYPQSCESNTSSYGSEGNDLSKYALDAIFRNLIYPDVRQGQFFTLDTLVQSAYTESKRTAEFHRHSCTYTRDGERGSSSLNRHDRQPRLAKRKRSCDVSYDNEDRKRVKSDVLDSFHSDNVSHIDGDTAVMHKRVREVMCYI